MTTGSIKGTTGQPKGKNLNFTLYINNIKQQFKHNLSQKKEEKSQLTNTKVYFIDNTYSLNKERLREELEQEEVLNVSI